IDYGELLLEKIPSSEGAAHADELRDQEKRLFEEMKRRPECPPIYWQLSRIYKLLGMADREAEYHRLHQQKLASIDKKERYDQYGRPRC
ncbi:MAG: hypothetical protein ACREID_09450, partial [Planctomycetota bacterium]